jgi:hypothetical protein
MISIQEYMFGHKTSFVAVRVSERVFLIYLLISLFIIYFFAKKKHFIGFLIFYLYHITTL